MCQYGSAPFGRLCASAKSSPMGLSAMHRFRMDSEYIVKQPTIWYTIVHRFVLRNLSYHVWTNVSQFHTWHTLAAGSWFFSLFFICRFTPANINQWANEFNQQHRGLVPNVTNALFINGDNDPYRDLNLRSPLNNSTLVINLPGKSDNP